MLGLWLVAFFFAPFLAAAVLLGSVFGLARQEEKAADGDPQHMPAEQ